MDFERARMHIFSSHKVENEPFCQQIEGSQMNSQLFNLYNASGLGRLPSFVKEAVSGNSEIPLEQILLVSRVLFAIVMIGFIGYFFDQTKQAIKETVKPRQ